MRKLLMIVVATVLSAPLAMADDTPLKAPVAKAHRAKKSQTKVTPAKPEVAVPVAVPVAEAVPAEKSAAAWTKGVYFGLNLGMGSGKNIQDIGGVSWEDEGYPAVEGTNNNLVIGGQAGYNYVIESLLIGVEGDISGANYEKITIGAPYYDPSNSHKSQAAIGQQVSTIATLRARAGFVADRTLIYVTGGLALTNGNVTLKDGADHTTGNTDNITAFGWAAGAGAEYAFNKNWSMKAEYLHIETRGDAHTYSVAEDEHYSSANTFTDNIVRVGLNYRF